MFKRIFTAAMVFGIAATAPPALAQMSCGYRERIVERLSGHFAEELTAAGLQSETQYIEIWSAPESGTFTVLMTRPDGISCVIAAGTNWHQKPATPVPTDTPS
ncbi:hypothetical protein DDZ14_18260 [Maritimibacter sp. 55A14]|uniref:hypothetical protein n=1 Tax=Maritimibacter sp. 55A14 TaxID=2174844 RepID=UPI000D61AB9C|nr:hypothetical protein [Maritimibacter sp. 55A14]PWE28856.1 hypothetical protein DDZ14_18260 [Maritimibacter sp. 55A14]